MRDASTPPSRRVALATGGSAGHVTPALAVAAAYRTAHPDADVRLLGCVGGFEARLLSAVGQHCQAVPAAPWYGVSPMARLRALGQLVAGVRRARRTLAADRVALVVGFGGYASAGAVLAARSLGIATAVHEANAVPGLANRLLSRVVDRVFLGAAGAELRCGAKRTRLTGTPIRAEVARLAAVARSAPDGEPVRLLICGGSQGSPFLNRRAPELAQALRARGLRLAVHHQSGRAAAEPIRAAYAAGGVAAEVVSYLEDVAAAYRRADLAISAAGAVTLAELAAAGVPAVLVPLATASGDHQSDNAAAWSAYTGAPWVRERAWHTDAMADAVAALLRDRGAWQALAARTRQLARPDAAAAVVAECEALLTTQ